MSGSRSQADGRVERHGSKRRKINTTRQSDDDDDNETSSSSGLSSDSDLDSEPPSRAAITQTAGVRANDADDTSSSGSSSEDNTDQPSTPPLATSNTSQPLQSSTDIHNRLSSFFSRLAEQRAKPDAAADEVIEEGSSDSGYEDDDEGKQYVELDLALGVLSEDPDGGDVGEVRIPRGQEEGSLSDDAEDGRGEDGGGGADVLGDLRSVADGGGGKLRHGGKKRAIEEVG